MKKTFYFIILLFFIPFKMFASSISAYAEELKPWLFLIETDRYNVVLDYSSANICGLNSEEFLNTFGESTESRSKSALVEWKMRFFGTANRISKNNSFGTFKDCEYTMVLKFVYINDNGDLKCLCSFADRDGNDMGVSKDFNCGGGHYGDIINLIGDGHESLGYAVGKFIKDRKYTLEYYVKKKYLKVEMVK